MSAATFPFSAVVGQSRMRLALLLVAVEPRIGGVLIRGERGTAKSTVVRSLARLLPSGRMRTLALGATEDRLVGGIDLEATVASGTPRFMKGLLAEADGGMLYVDEVNLLDDHLADLVLDAAASGVCVAEREGVSLAQDAGFALVGTMNPEEGELRPQLLDRFGLCVDVGGELDVGERVTILERRLAFDADPAAFLTGWADREAALATRLAAARGHVGAVRLDAGMSGRIAAVAAEANAAGHRAELVMSRAARAHAAWCGRDAVRPADVAAVTELALVHRRRPAAPPPDPEARRPDSGESAPGRERPERPGGAPRGDEGRLREPAPGQPLSAAKNDPGEPMDQPPSGEPVPDQVTPVGEVFRVRSLEVGEGRVPRAGSGRRQATRSADGRGRYIGARPTDRAVDLALDATLRASAVHQRSRRARARAQGDPRAGLAVLIEPGDWRRKVRVRRTGSLMVLCVDASGSMGARNRMLAGKGAVLSLLLDAYVKRDQVALVSFRRTGADVLVPPTSSIEAAERRLRELPVGGRTPLAAGLVEAHRVSHRVLAKDPGLRALAVVVTDGRGNIDLGGRVSSRATAEAIDVAGRLAADERIAWVVVDTEPAGVMARGCSGELAAALRARRFAIEDLKADDLVSVVHTVQGPGTRREDNRWGGLATRPRRS